MENPTKAINDMLSECTRLALAYIEHEAREIMRRDPRVKSFCMAMGSATLGCEWTEEWDGEIVQCSDNCDEWEGAERLFTLICDFDRHLGLTGYPLRIDGPESPALTDW